MPTVRPMPALKSNSVQVHRIITAPFNNKPSLLLAPIFRFEVTQVFPSRFPEAASSGNRSFEDVRPDLRNQHQTLPCGLRTIRDETERLWDRPEAIF